MLLYTKLSQFSYTFFEISNFEKWRFFLENLIFSKFPGQLNPMDLALAFSLQQIHTFIQIFDIFWTRNPVRFLFDHNAKHGYLDEKMHWFTILCGPKSVRLSQCFRITLREGRILPLYESLFQKEEYPHSTSQGNRAVNRQPSFRTEDS